MDDKARIEKIMEAENMNSTQFAIETGIQTSTLSHILNGRNQLSLKVVRQIVKRFKNISSDWLISGEGTMYRQEKHSHTPTLFDFEATNNSKSVVSAPEDTPPYGNAKNTNQYKTDYSPETPIQQQQPIINIPPVVEKPPRRIKRIIVYYDDNSFQEFIDN
ncbi:XRE family transcriptional regulator [Paludibacter sp. 221]|uniref:helix-turn-helix domain-containing protein n=1 Tax=Paludibacter sp. 221 TaxID=2302939 RepID=UPI0013D11FFC|nr:helix-turn-helix transcriptional regulator [Paludibacter sp. 221]NDV47245.1 XRE family transcriptional regulator [Paludibacter sp. 221]